MYYSSLTTHTHTLHTIIHTIMRGGREGDRKSQREGGRKRAWSTLNREITSCCRKLQVTMQWLASCECTHVEWWESHSSSLATSSSIDYPGNAVVPRTITNS